MPRAPRPRPAAPETGGRGPVATPWGRFLVRLAAIAWPLTALAIAAVPRGCAPLGAPLSLAPLSLAGTVALVVAVEAAEERRRRRAWRVALVLGGASVAILLALLLVWPASGACSLGIS